MNLLNMSHFSEIMFKLHLYKIGFKTALYVGFLGIMLAIIQSAVMISFEIKTGHEQVKKTTNEMLVATSAAASNVVFELNERAATELVNGLLAFEYITMGRITDKLGNTVIELKKDTRLSGISNSIGKLLNLEDEIIQVPLVNPKTIAPDLGTLSVKVSAAVLTEPVIKNAKFYFFIGFFNAIIFILVICLIVYFYITNPLKTLQMGVKEIGDGLLDKRIPVNRKDELGDLAAGVNKMANQLKQSFDDLRVSEMKYRDLVENINDVIFTADEKGVITYISPTIEAIAGYSPDEMIGRVYSDFIYMEDLPKINRAFKETLAGKRDPHEYRIIKKSGETTWIRTSSRPTIENGHTIGLRGVLVDINITKELETQLRQAQKMESIGTLAGGIAHDFNNILSSIFGYAELARAGIKTGEDIEENLNKLLSAAFRARNLVKHILTFSQQTDIQKHPTLIRPLIKEILRFIRSSIPATIQIKTDLGDEDLLVLADPTHIHQIIMNLCTNAAYAMRDKGGKLDIRVDSVEITNEVTLLYKEIKRGRYLRLTVTDTGTGIEKSIIDKIFDPFFTTKERGKGSGLGLSVTHGIVKDMEGAIAVESEPGKGTTFEILLPAFKGEVNGVISEQFPVEKRNGRLLFVDDEKPIVDTVKKMLKHMGYDVVTTTSTTYALEIFKTQPDSFDLVLTDMTMPEMTGFELSKKLKEIRPDIPVILCTGYSFNLTEPMLAQKGINKIIVKPIIMSKLSAAISAVLLQSGGPDTL